jgi:triosephosphate isomerase
MNKTVVEARALAEALVPVLRPFGSVERVLCPPFTALAAVGEVLRGEEIGLGAQNMHWEESGAFTGEISPLMVQELCRYVILGHSERRAHFGETDETINRKLRAAFAHGLVPILCVGETLSENEAGRTAEVVTTQLEQCLKGIDPGDLTGLVIAYEPVWAIGTGRAATPQVAAEVVSAHIRPALARLYDQNVAQSVRVLYGGSVTGSNAADFFHEEEIDGALVGGASLKAADFTQIVAAAAA